MIQRKARFGFNTHGQIIHIPFKGQKKNVTIIAAMDAFGGIGLNNGIPWNVKPDMQQFARLTRKHAVVMGRKTYDSLPPNAKENGLKILSERLNIVVSRYADMHQKETTHPNLIYVRSIKEAIDVAGDRQIFIIGGSEIYTQALTYANDMILTRIHLHANCDTFFPDFMPGQFLRHQLTDHTHKDVKYTFQYWRRWQNELLTKGEPRHERFLLAQPEVPGRETAG